jgi:hypothetical protein
MASIRQRLSRATSCACARIFLLLCGCATSGRIPADHATTSLPIVLPPADLSDVLAPVEIPQRFFSAGGFVCLDASGDAEVDVTHDGSQDLPAWAQRATVFLNGWRLSYLSKDHHVNGLYAEITNVRRAGTALRWRAHGRIFDRNDDDAYRFCYSYTAIAWNPEEFDARVQGVGDTDLVFGSRFHLPTKRQITVDVASTISENATIAVLPRGFSFALELDGFICCRTDQHLFQVAFSRNRADAMIDPADDPRREVWEFQTVLKDNKKPRNIKAYWTSETVALIGGTGIGIMRQPFELQARRFEKPWYSRCVSADGERRTDSFVVENVPFQHAVPVLTGFDMSFNCGDQHVKEVGARIVDFSYERPPGSATGTLRYRLESVLRDKSGKPNHRVDHRVHVLGFGPGRQEPFDSDF